MRVCVGCIYSSTINFARTIFISSHLGQIGYEFFSGLIKHFSPHFFLNIFLSSLDLGESEDHPATLDAFVLVAGFFSTFSI